jgi:hypothetical protein
MNARRRSGRLALVGMVAAIGGAMLVGCRAGPTPGPSGGTATASMAGSSAAPMAGTATASMAGSSAAPSSVTPDVRPLRGLLVLAGAAGASTLELVGDSGATRALTSPDPAVVWISAAGSGIVLATTIDGRAFLGGPMVAGALTWQQLVPTERGAARRAGPLSFGTLSPDGRRAAFVAADFATARPFELLIVDTATGTAVSIPIPFPAEGAPPQWAGDRLVVLTRERGDRPGAVIVDPAGGAIAIGPGPIDGPRPSGTTGWIERISGLSVAAGDSRVAVAADLSGSVEVFPAGPWLAGRDAPGAVVTLDPEVDASRAFAWLALSPAGDRLAIVRTNKAGDPVAVSLHDEAAGWRQMRRVPLPVDAIRAVVAWLP